ncbi:MAG: hypothetical protein ACOCTS_00455 [Thermodesulfobacteriota bacterium]
MKAIPPFDLISAAREKARAGALDTLKLVVTGSEDEFAPPRLIEPLVGKWNPNARFQVIEEADHFLFSHLDELEASLAAEIPRADEPGGN